MKKLIALLAITATASVAFAEGADFSHSGDFRVQHFMHQDADGNGDAGPGTTDDTRSRFRWGTTFRKGDKFTGHLGLVNASTWGSNGLASQTPDGNTEAAAVDNNADLLVVNEAYGIWQASDELSIKAGRGGATLGNGKHVAKNDYEQIHKAFDGLLATYDAEFGSIGLFFVQGAEFEDLGGTAGEDNEATFAGLSFDFKSLPDVIKQANLHVVQVDQQADAGVAGTVNENEMRIGLNVAGDAGGVFYDLSYVTVSGEDSTNDQDITSDMMDVVIGYHMPDMMDFKFWLGMHQDSGQDPTDTDDAQYDPFHYDMHHNSGLMDVIAWGGTTYNHAGFSLKPSDGLTVEFHYFMFTMSEADDTTVSTGTNGGSWTAGTAGEDDLGTEMDLVLKKMYGDDFNIEFRYGQFAPGERFDGGAEDTYTQMYLAGNLSF